MDSKGFQEFGKIGLTNTLGTLFLVTLGTNTVDIQKWKETQEPEQDPDNCSCMIKNRFPENQGYGNWTHSKANIEGAWQSSLNS